MESIAIEFGLNRLETGSPKSILVLLSDVSESLAAAQVPHDCSRRGAMFTTLNDRNSWRRLDRNVPLNWRSIVFDEPTWPLPL